MPQKLSAFIVPYWKSLLLMLWLNMIATVLLALQPMIGKFIVDRVFIQRAYPFSLALAWGIGCILLMYVFFLATKYYHLRVHLHMAANIRGALYERLLSTTLCAFSKKRAGDAISRLNEDAGEAQRMYTDWILQTVIVSLNVVLEVGFLLYLDWSMAMCCFLLLPVLLVGLQKFRHLLYMENLQLRKLSAGNQSFLLDTLSSLRFIQAGSLEMWCAEKYRNELQTINRQHMKLTFFSGCAQGIPQLVILLSTIGTVSVLGGKVLAGETTLGALLAFSAYQAKFFSSVQGFAQLYIRFQKGKAAIVRVQELLNLPVQEDGTQVMPEFRSVLEFRRVRFRHEEERDILQEITCSVKKGEKVAIVGPNGAGKSTLADLLARLYTPVSGAIYCDGIDIRTFTRDSWNRRVCLVTHDTPVWHETVVDYLQMGAYSFSQQEIKQALVAVGLWQEIMEMPEGLNSKLGERGRALSTGQKQRLALARAFLRDPDIFIFDEAMCHLDEKMEQDIVSFIRRHLWHKTVLMITHRMQHIGWADRIWFMEDGGLLERVHSSIGGNENAALERRHG